MTARILVIEDNPANLELMRYLLQAYGHTIRSRPPTAPRACARAAARAARPDHLRHAAAGHGRLRGGAASRRPTRACAACPRVAVTAFAMVGDRRQGAGGRLRRLHHQAHRAREFRRTGGGVPAGRAPIAHQPAPGASRISAAWTVRRGLSAPHILVVDDLPANVSLLQTLLESFGTAFLPPTRRRRPWPWRPQRRPTSSSRTCTCRTAAA